MVFSEPIRVLLLAEQCVHDSAPLAIALARVPGFVVTTALPGTLLQHLSDHDVVVIDDPNGLAPDAVEALGAFVAQGGGCVGLVHPERQLPELFGVQVGSIGPEAELRVRIADPARAAFRRMPEAFFVRDRLLPLLPQVELESLLFTIWRYEHTAIAASRAVGSGRVITLGLQISADPMVQQALYRLIRVAAGRREPAPLGVAVIGYGPSDAVGYRHGVAVSAVPGLEFRAACDTNESRLRAAAQDFPGLHTYLDARGLADDPRVDVVIIATPPNSHAKLAIELLRAGKHVVCEKPLCITVAEAEAMIETAAASGRMLTTHQNRRWDADFLAIAAALRAGAIGDPFYLETFIGGYFHPCDYWHSHQPISGGAVYDWGAHYLDSILQLFPGRVAAVSSTAHKRVWHDVTNADQERIMLRFADGREAEFMYSEVAAIRKPKWYILGTEGAIVSDWTQITLREADRTRFYSEAAIPVTEAPPRLTLRRPSAHGEFADQELPPRAAPAIRSTVIWPITCLPGNPWRFRPVKRCA
ncbi:MAG: Gfo/Idh/MocA family oxidoreductase [Oscillochloris sp.]|nr:Gfo/Idh/MocA family oxidoreductase [Oscillochloris sp.]